MKPPDDAATCRGRWRYVKSEELRSGFRGLVEPLLHALMIDEAGMLGDRRAVLEHDEVRDATNVVALSELGMPVGIHFEHERPTAHAGGGARHLRRCRLAGPAPFGPEVDEHGHARSAHDLREGRGVDLEWLGRRRKRVLARA